MPANARGDDRRDRRRRTVRAVRALVRGGHEERAARRDDDAGDRDARRRAVGAGGAAEGRRRERVRLLYQPRKPQGRGAEQPTRARRCAFTGSRWAGRSASRARSRRPAPRRPTPISRRGRATARSAPGPRSSRGRSTSRAELEARFAEFRGQIRRRRSAYRGRPTGPAIACGRNGSSSGRNGRSGCMTAWSSCARARHGARAGCSHRTLAAAHRLRLRATYASLGGGRGADRGEVRRLDRHRLGRAAVEPGQLDWSMPPPRWSSSSRCARPRCRPTASTASATARPSRWPRSARRPFCSAARCS